MRPTQLRTPTKYNLLFHRTYNLLNPEMQFSQKCISGVKIQADVHCHITQVWTGFSVVLETFALIVHWVEDVE